MIIEDELRKRFEQYLDEKWERPNTPGHQVVLELLGPKLYELEFKRYVRENYHASISRTIQEGDD